jgi:methyl-accepting chemotaxis protein
LPEAPWRWGLGALALYGLLVLRWLLGGRLERLQHGLTQALAGDLSTRVVLEGRDELARLGQSIEQLTQGLSAMVADVRSNAALVAYSGQGLASNNSELSDRTEQQAASLEQTNASVQQLSDTVRQTARTAQEVNQRTTQVHGITVQGRDAMNAAVASMSGIQESSRRVHDIVGVIDGIAFQTNILALNAAVEAARAGEQGRGFAVVASEVRSLAGRSAEAAKEIKALIDDSVHKVENGLVQVSGARQTIDESIDAVKRVTGIMADISLSSVEQGKAIDRVAHLVVQLDTATQETVRMVEESTATARTLEGNGNLLVRGVGAFMLR